MLSVQCSLARRLGSKPVAATQSVRRPKKGLQHSALKCYSTIRRRVVTPASEASSSVYSKLDAASAEKRKKELDREFDELFFRKPKVLIVGTNIAAMTAALTLQHFNVNPDILDTGHYMHSLAPTNVRSQIVPMNAMRVFETLGIKRQIEAIGTPMTIYGRSDAEGAALASMNFESLRTYQDRPTLGVNYLELERTLQAIVSEKSKIQPQCFLEAIDSPPAPDTKMAFVKWNSNVMGHRTSQKGVYDCVIVAEGPFSASRELQWPDAYDLEGVAHLYECTIPRPAKILKGYSSDQWGMDRRVGFFPAGSANRDQLYVYALVRHQKVSSDAPTQQLVASPAMMEHFTQFGGPWKDIAEAVGAQPTVNKTILVSGNFKGGVSPVKGRVVAIGDSCLTLPGPCLGNELGMAVEQAHYMGNVLSFNTTPIFSGIHSFINQYVQGASVVNSLRNELKSAINFESNLPNFFKKMMLKFTNSDRGLVSQQLDFLGLKADKKDDQEAVEFSHVQALRREWHSLSEAQRDEAKLSLKSKLEKQQADMEVDLQQLAAQQSHQSQPK